MNYFQLIDNKNICPSIVDFDGNIDKNPDYSNLTRTWAYNHRYSQKNVEIGQIYALGKTLDDVCPEHLKDRWEKIKTLHKAYENSFTEGHINSVKEFCFYDLVPESFIKSFFGIKNEITKHVFEHYDKPPNYNHLYKLLELTDDISRHKLNIQPQYLNDLPETDRIIRLKNKLSLLKHRIKYDVFGSITGRLTVKKGYFPILTLDKKFRNIVHPNNRWFIELDYNAAELRTFLGLNNVKQPEYDIHEWNSQLYNNIHINEPITRDEIKKKFLAWFYSGNDDLFGVEEIDKSFNKKAILNEYYSDNIATTPYGRRIETEDRKALNTINQSASADLFYEQTFQVNDYIKQNKLVSYISFLIHDSVIIDVDRNDLKHIRNIINIFSQTRYGKYMVRSKIGENLGNMKDFKGFI